MNMRVTMGKAENAALSTVAAGSTAGKRRVSLMPAPWEAAAKAGMDLGPITVRQVARKRIEAAVDPDPKTGKVSNPNGVMRTRRETWVERYLRKGKLTTRQANIAEKLQFAHQGPARASGFGLTKVDMSSGAGDQGTMLIDRLYRPTDFLLMLQGDR